MVCFTAVVSMRISAGGGAGPLPTCARASRTKAGNNKSSAVPATYAPARMQISKYLCI